MVQDGPEAVEDNGCSVVMALVTDQKVVKSSLGTATVGPLSTALKLLYHIMDDYVL